MNEHQTPNWIEASTLLREAMEQYRDQQEKLSLTRVTDDILCYIQDQTEKLLDEKTIRQEEDSPNS